MPVRQSRWRIHDTPDNTNECEDQNGDADIDVEIDKSEVTRTVILSDLFLELHHVFAKQQHANEKDCHQPMQYDSDAVVSCSVRLRHYPCPSEALFCKFICLQNHMTVETVSIRLVETAGVCQSITGCGTGV